MKGSYHFESFTQIPRHKITLLEKFAFFLLQLFHFALTLERSTSNPFERNSFHLVCSCEFLPCLTNLEAYFMSRKKGGLRKHRAATKKERSNFKLKKKWKKITHFISLVISIVILNPFDPNSEIFTSFLFHTISLLFNFCTKTQFTWFLLNLQF